MSILNDMNFESNSNYKFNFDGGDMSSDAGMLLIKEFSEKIGLLPLLEEFKTNDDASFRIHTDAKILFQLACQIIAGYFEDCRADDIADDPVFKAILDKDIMASQPTISRFYSRLDHDTLEQLNEIAKTMREIIYSIEMPAEVLFDIDTTHFETYGNQEGSSFNTHYQSTGYHPILCYDAISKDLLKVELREGAKYCSKDVAINLFLRGDSGFATPELYELCEKYGVRYVIRLKENEVLYRMSKSLHSKLYAIVKNDSISYAVVYGEFMYQAKSWDHPRRVICKIEKQEGQFLHQITFLVTNMDLSPEWIVNLYSNRGRMENFIKEGKEDMDFSSVSSSSMTVNANRLEIHQMAYNIFNWFRRITLPEDMKKMKISTLRNKILKIAARVVHHARHIVFKLNSSFPYKDEFQEILHNIGKLQPIAV